MRTLGRLLTQDLLLRLPLGEFVDQFVWVADLPNGGFLDVLHADAADHAGDKRSGWIYLRRPREEILEVGALCQLLLQRLLAVAGQPADDLINLRLRPTLLLRLQIQCSGVNRW